MSTALVAIYFVERKQALWNLSRLIKLKNSKIKNKTSLIAQLCGKQVSRNAKSCVECGEPIHGHIGFSGKLFGLLMLFCSRFFLIIIYLIDH